MVVGVVLYENVGVGSGCGRLLGRERKEMK